MWSGPKSAKKALYSSTSSTEKYTGGRALANLALDGTCLDLELRFVGDEPDLSGTTKGVVAVGGDEYAAR